MAWADVGLIVFLSLCACKKAEPPSVAAPDATAETAPVSGAEVVLRPDGAAPVRVRVRVARTEEQRRRGLMYVQNLPVDEGMLFVFPEDDILQFWMRNTLIPLDMIFIRADLTVAGVVANAEPLTLANRSVGKPSRYVLEVNGGMAKKWGVVAGTPVTFDKVPGYTAKP